jgi:hypothetical protein
MKKSDLLITESVFIFTLVAITYSDNKWNSGLEVM